MAKRSNKKKKNLQAIQAARHENKAVVRAQPVHLDWKLLLKAALIIAAGLWVFSPAFHGDWLWDDRWYILDNPLLTQPSGLWKFWFAPGSWVEYYPLEETVRWLQWQLWHNATLGYHLTNVILHLANALMVWRLLDKFGLRLAWLGGLLFALHPAQVESVAYIVELKNTLSLQPFLWAMCFWIDYEDHQRPRDYACALALFLIAMLCKISMAPFPVVVLLYAWWKRDRIGWSDLKASAPFFAISLVLGVMTIMAGIWSRPLHVSPDLAVPLGGLLSRMACAGLTLSFYLWNFFWPVGLLPIYPHWTVDPPSLLQFLPWPILGAILYGCWTKRATWGRHVLLGLGFFLIMLAPFLGFISVSYMSFTWVMDHLLYLPGLGLIGLIVAGLERATSEIPRPLRPVGMGIVAAVFTLLAYETHLYAGVFLNEQTLWRYTLAHNPDAWLARNNLGVSLKEQGHLAEAIEQYNQAIKARPNYATAFNNLGVALLESGLLAPARAHYETALRLYPDYANAHNNLGKLLMQLGETPAAIEHYRIALKIDPDYADAHFDLGNAFQQQGQLFAAKEQYEAALKLNPRFLEAYNNLGATLNNLGQTEEAMNTLNAVLQLNPNFADAHNNLGAVLFRQGRLTDAIAEFEKAAALRPNDPDAQNNLAKAKAMLARQPAPKINK